MSGTGAPLDPRNVLRAFHAALANAGLPRQPFHALRHAFATLMIEEGVDLAVISKVLGHADLGTTADLYGHLIPWIARQTSERIGVDPHKGLYQLSPSILCALGCREWESNGYAGHEDGPRNRSRGPFHAQFVVGATGFEPATS